MQLISLLEIPDGVPFPESKETQDILIIRSIDPCIKENGDSHHTSKYDVCNRQIDPQLVVRRGQTFSLDITLNRPYNDQKDMMSFIFSVEGM